MPPVRQVDLGGGIELIDWDFLQRPAGGHILRRHLLNLPGKGLVVALGAAEDMVQNFRCGLVLILMV